MVRFVEAHRSDVANRFENVEVREVLSRFLVERLSICGVQRLVGDDREESRVV